MEAVNGLSYRLQAGRSLAIVGESGSGKSASCLALIGLLPRSAAVSGSICFAGTELLDLTEAKIRTFRGAKIAMVFQDPDNALNPTMRVGRQVSEAISLHTGLDRQSAKQKVVELLHSLKIAAPEQRVRAYPHELSGGMRQRIMLAVALAGNPDVLIADESTRSLDLKTRAEVIRLIDGERRNREMAVIFITHDLRLAAGICDDMLVMRSGSAIEYGPSSRLLLHPRTPYTLSLLAAMPRLDGNGRLNQIATAHVGSHG